MWFSLFILCLAFIVVLNLWHYILSVLKNSSFYLQIFFWLILFLLFLDLAAFMLIFFHISYISCFFYVLIIFFLSCFRLFSLVLSSRICIFYPAVFYLTINPLVLNFGDWGFSYRIPICFFFRKFLPRFSEILFSQFILLLVFPFVNCSCILVCLIDKYWLISEYWAMKLKGTFKALNGVLFVLVEFTFDFGRQIIAVASLNLSLIWFQAGF